MANGSCRLVVRLIDSDENPVMRLGYMTISEEERAILPPQESALHYPDNMFGNAVPQSDGAFAVFVGVSTTTTWGGLSAEYYQDRFLYLLIEKRDGTSERVVVELEDLWQLEAPEMTVLVP